MPASFRHLSELVVDGLDRIRSVNDASQLRRIVEEWDELAPRSPPHVDDAGILFSEVVVEVAEFDLGRFEAQTSGSSKTMAR